MKTAESNSYLSTGDVENFIGTTRRKLTECASKGVVEPFAVNERPNADRRWTLTQSYAMAHLSEFRRRGYSFDDIAQLTGEGHVAFCAKLEELELQELRQARRSARGLERYRQEQEQTAGLLGREGFYLRYIPQRFFAIAPALSDEEKPGGPEHMRLLSQCIGIAEVAGWCPTGLSGSVACFTEDWIADAVFAYTELGMCPQPRPTAGSDMDSGCYQVFYEEELPIDCNHDCASCQRYGRAPSDYERFTWAARSRTQPAMHDRVRTAENMEAPYPTGPWATYTAELLGDEEDAAGAGDATAGGRAAGTGPATGALGDIEGLCGVVPRIMPQELHLPYGVTACVVPAGVYLCCQHDERNQAHAFERAVGLAGALPRRAVCEDDERAAHAQLVALMDGAWREARGVANLSTLAPVVGDPEAIGWNCELAVEDFASTTLLSDTAPETPGGTGVVCEELPPLRTSDAPRFETQVLVSSPKLAPRGSIR